jgi:hypothetical protein
MRSFSKTFVAALMLFSRAAATALPRDESSYPGLAELEYFFVL